MLKKFLICALFIFLSSPVHLIADAAPAIPTEGPRLLSDYQAIGRGETLRFAVFFDLPSPWHTYWKNPGGSGLATKIVWGDSHGLLQTPTAWPVPKRFVQPGEIVGFGYEGQVAFLPQLDIPKDFKGQEVLSEAEVKWLLCAHVCVPGKKQLSLKIPVGPSKKSGEFVSFEGFIKKLPEPLNQHSSLVQITRKSVEVQAQGKMRYLFQFDWNRNIEEVQVFPELESNTLISAVSLERQGNISRYEFSLGQVDSKVLPLSLPVLIAYGADLQQALETNLELRIDKKEN